MTRATVVGGGIAGAGCAGALAAAGVGVDARDRGRRLGGRMASRAMRGTGTEHDGRPVDIGAAYFTVTDPEFAAVVAGLEQAGIVRPWTDTFHVAGPGGTLARKPGPVRYAAPCGLRSVVEALWAAVPEAEVRFPAEVGRVSSGDAGLQVDEQPVDAIALCLPEAQARRIVAEPLAAQLPADGPRWEAVIAVTCLFDRRTWDPAIDGVFVNDDPTLTLIVDDGRRRGDDAPVLVAHVHPRLAAGHLSAPDAVIPAVVEAIRQHLGIGEEPRWVDVQRWTLARPTIGQPDDCWLHPALAVGMAGDAWAGGPRVEAAWRSGRALGHRLAERLVGGTGR